MISKDAVLDNSMNEEWRDIPEHPGYCVSNMGNIMAKARVWVRRGKPGVWKQHILKTVLKNKSYLAVDLRMAAGGVKRFVVHRIVAKVWLGPPPPGMVVNHKNGIKTDNRVNNLEWVTPSRNVAHAYEIGRKVAIQGSDHAESMLSEDEARDIFYSGASGIDLAAKYGISASVVSAIRRKRAWKHIHALGNRDYIPGPGGPINPARGSSHGNAKLDESRAMEIFKSTLSNVKTAAIHGVTPATVGAIKRKRTWVHIHQ